MAAKRNANVALRRESLLGVNQFPNFSEISNEDFPQSVFQAADMTEKDAEAETLKPYRAAQPFEALRYKTDRFTQTKKRPVAFMLTLGNLTMRKARAQFSCNFFAVAGFEVIDNNGFQSVEEGVDAAREKQADIIVLCSSDEEYSQYAPQAAALLDKEILVIAGNPQCKSELEAKGIKNFIHVKSNALEELKMYQKQLKI